VHELKASYPDNKFGFHFSPDIFMKAIPTVPYFSPRPRLGCIDILGGGGKKKINHSVAELRKFSKNSRKAAQSSGRQNGEEDKFHTKSPLTLGAIL